MTETIYECKVCGVVSKRESDLCHPDRQDDIHDYCGTTRERSALCREIRDRLPVVCGTCGRPSEQVDLVCDPLLLDGEIHEPESEDAERN